MSVSPESDPQAAGERDTLANKLAIHKFLLMIAALMVVLLVVALLISMSRTAAEQDRARGAEEIADAAEQAATEEDQKAADQWQAAQVKILEAQTALHRAKANLATHDEAQRRRSMARYTQGLATQPTSRPSWTDDRQRQTLKAHKDAAKLTRLATTHISRKQYVEAEELLLKAATELETNRPVTSDWLATRTRSLQWRILAQLESLYGPDALNKPIKRALVGELVRRPSLDGAAALRGETAIIPASELGGKETVLCLTGPPVAFKVANVVGDVSVSPMAGKTPVLLRVSAEGPGLHPFAIDVQTGGKTLTATGVLLVAEWDVRFFKGRPRQVLGNHSAASEDVVGREPLARQHTDAIRFTWWDRPPAPDVPADSFSTVATTSVRLNAGTYKIWTSADDGVRVWIDDSRVIDDWRWRPPRENATTVVLKDGLHKIRIEHYEMTNHAQLHFGMELLY